jgi:subtilisin family serine protease
MGCGLPKRLFRHSGRHEAKHVAFGLHRWYKVICGDASASPVVNSEATREAIDRVARGGQKWPAGVNLVQPSYVMTMSYVPDDPLLSSQWHYDAIFLKEAWDIVAGSPAVVVQVVDTGLQIDHPEFSEDELWTNPGEICGNGLDDDDNGFVDDCHGYNFADESGTDLSGDGSHGQHTAGTIAAATDNGVGVAGVAGGQGGAAGAKLMIATVERPRRRRQSDDPDRRMGGEDRVVSLHQRLEKRRP